MKWAWVVMQDILQGHLARGTTPDFPEQGDGTAWQPSWGQKKPKVGCALGSPQGGEIYWLDPWEMIFTLHLWKVYKITNSQTSPCPSPSPSKTKLPGDGVGLWGWKPSKLILVCGHG